VHHRHDGRRPLGATRPNARREVEVFRGWSCAGLCEHVRVTLHPETPSDNDPPDEAVDPYALAELAAARLAEMSGVGHHDVAVVLGTGLADAATGISSISTRHDLGKLPGFPPSVVSHQRSEFWSLEVGDLNVLAFLGRLHLYEGYRAMTVAHPVRTAVAAGCGTVIITNASGSLRPEFRPGDLVMIADHLNLTGTSPLAGLPVGAGYPSPFVDLVDAWSPRLRRLAMGVDPSLSEGVYAQVHGPQFETPAEIRMLQTMGADLVGMSSALEAIAARQMGAEVLGFSLVTNMAAGMEIDGVSPESIIACGERHAPYVGHMIGQLVSSM
jgi:purine-nucleoside phosphorylase